MEELSTTTKLLFWCGLAIVMLIPVLIVWRGVKKQREQAIKEGGIEIGSTNSRDFEKGMRFYREAQPSQHEWDRFRSEKQTALSKALEIFNRIVEEDKNNVNALIMKAQVLAEDDRASNRWESALSEVERAIQLAPNCAKAYEVQGNLLVRIVGRTCGLDGTDLKARADSYKRAFDIDPNYKSEFGSMRLRGGNTNEGFRKEIEWMYRRSKEMKISHENTAKLRTMQEQGQTDVYSEIRGTLKYTDGMSTKSVEEAVIALMDYAVKASPEISEDEIQKRYSMIATKWGSQKLYDGDHEKMSDLVDKNLRSIKSTLGFSEFEIKSLENEGCGQINAILTSSFVGIRVWKNRGRYFVCGNRSFMV